MQLKNGLFDFLQHETLHTIWRIFSPFVSLKCSKSAFSSHFFFHSSSVGGHRHRWIYIVVVGGWHSQRLTYSWNRNRTHSRVHAVDVAFIWWIKKNEKTFCARTFEIECSVWRIHFSSPSSVAGVSEWAMLAYEMKKIIFVWFQQ